MKTVRNAKEWNEYGWLYHMSRIVNGQCLAYDLGITGYEMHYRDVVAWKLRHARQELALAVAEARNLPEFT